MKAFLRTQAKCKQLWICRSQQGRYGFDCDFDKMICIKILGVRTQITNILRWVSQCLHIIRIFKAHVTKPEIVRVCRALIISLLLCASTAYGQLPGTLLARMEEFQNPSHFYWGTSSFVATVFQHCRVNSKWLLRISFTKWRPTHHICFRNLCQADYRRLTPCPHVDFASF